jgi:polyisoprenoid-binding protein YceI
MTTTTTSTTTSIPGYVAGSWTIDPVHSDVSFTVRHMMVSKVRGRFGRFEGSFVTAENPLDSSVTASIDLGSIDTNNPQRDAHIRSSDFFDVEAHPTMTFHSTGIRPAGDGTFLVDGELRLRGVTRPVTLRLEFNGFGPDPYGGTRAGFSASTELNRRDFGIDISMTYDGGGIVIGDKVTVNLEIEAILDAPAAA